MQRYEIKRARVPGFCSISAVSVPTRLGIDAARAEQPAPPCHSNSNAAADEAAVRGRGISPIYPGSCRIGWVSSPTDRTLICHCRSSMKPITRAGCSNISARHNRLRTERFY
jgi:hypothetical protein